MNITKVKFSKLQIDAWKYLQDDKTEMILYGGKANSGKSWLGCFYLLMGCISYPNTRWALCRKNLKRLKETSLGTFIDVCKAYDYKDYKINHNSNIISFPNGSEIYMLNLEWKPSDPEGDDFGGLEFTGVVIEELPQIPQIYFEVLYARIRYKLDEFNLTKKIFLTCNPSNGWIKTFFYNRWKKNTLPDKIKFLNAVGTTNPFRGKKYDSGLSLLSEASMKRYDGDWEYASAPDQIFTPDKLEKIFTGLQYGKEKDYYITCDPARMGEDSTVICLWEGLKIIHVDVLTKTEIPDIAVRIKEVMQKYNIAKNKVIVDSTGLGQGLRDILQCKEFHAVNKPFRGEKFDYVKSQLYFRLSKEEWSIADYIKSEYKEQIKRELEAIRDNSDDNKYKINSKDDQKLLLSNKSPDFADSIMLRMYFLYSTGELIFDVV
jgi:hypothetical protein